MSKPTDKNTQEIYQIQVQGWFSKRSAETFENLRISYYQDLSWDTSITVLTGPVVDQAALRGIINKLWDMNLSLVSVQRLHKEE